MPYTYAKQGSKYTVYKEKKGGERGEKVGSTKGTKEALKKYLAALHANETTNENIMNLANKVERFFMPKDKNMKFKEDLKDLYYTNRPQYDKVKEYYMNQIDSGRQSIDIEDVMNAFNEIERGLNEATSEEDKAVFDAIKTAGFKSWDYEDPKSGEVFYAKGRDAGEAARYLRYKYKLEKIDVSKITPTGLGAGITDNALVAIYTNKDINENKNKMKVNQLRQIIREEIEKAMKENALGLSPEGEILFNKWKAVKLKYNPELAAMSDEELLAMMREFERHEDEIDRRERLRDM